MSPFHNRPAELELYTPLVGSSMLELGNKKNAPYTYKRYFESLGIRHVSVDINGQDGALPKDLRKPLEIGTFDMVTNIGTSEHVSEQAPCWRNMLDAMHIGSVLLSCTPEPGQWQWHGEHYPDDSFYRDLADLNGLSLDRLYVSGDPPRRMWFSRMTRTELRPFRMPSVPIFFNVLP